MKKIGIYKITSPSGKVYIGQSTDIENRFIRYKGYRCKGQILLYNSLKKHGSENHKYEIIILCEESQLNDLERYYQDYYSVIDKNGLNLTLTNTNTLSGKRSKLTKDKISKNRSGINHTEETKKKISIFFKGYKRKPFSDKHKENLSKAATGRKLSKEHIEKMRLKLIGRQFSEETRKKMSLAQKNRKQKLNLSLQYGEQTENSGQ